MAKHTADVESSHSPRQRQTTLDSFQQRRTDSSTSKRLTTAIATWVATACRPVNVVEDVGLLEIICIASNDSTYELPSRANITSTIHNSYEEEKNKVEEALRQTNTVALTRDYWTSLSNDSYLRVTAHYFDTHWNLGSHTLTVMKKAERYMLTLR